MQLNTMEYTGPSNIDERDSDLEDDASHDGHSDCEIRECVSAEGDPRVGPYLHTPVMSIGLDGNDATGPDRPSNITVSHYPRFPTNHHLNALGSFMSMGNSHGIPNLQNNVVLEKLKMQVRDMKVDLMDKEYAAAHAVAFGSNLVQTPANMDFGTLSTMKSSYTHTVQTPGAQTANNINENSPSSSAGPPAMLNGNPNMFSFTSPTAPSIKDANPASNSSTSSETSNSPHPNNGWSFEEQYKQVRQLYEINDDPKRKEFLDDLFSFMQKRGSPINRLPIMAKSVLDLYELYNLVIARGGLVDVINKKLWQEIIKGLHLPSSITSAAFTLRTQYMKYLYPYECEKRNLSTPAELQAAIDGNRREGRRSSYGQYEAMHNQMQMPQIAHQSLPGNIQQMSPLALVTHAASKQQAQAAAVAAAAHNRLIAPSFGQVPNLVTQEFEQRMMEYIKLIQVKKEQNSMSNSSGPMNFSPQHQQQLLQQKRHITQNSEISTRDALNAFEMSRVAFWQIYHNNTSPTPASVNTSPRGGEQLDCIGNQDDNKVQFHDALSFPDSRSNFNDVKSEQELDPNSENTDHNDFQQHPPPIKRSRFPENFYLPPGITHHAAPETNCKADHHDSEADLEEENDNSVENVSENPLHDDRHSSKGTSVQHQDCNGSINDKSDDSAIESSTSTALVSSAIISPLLTKTKQTQPSSDVNNTGNLTMENFKSLPFMQALNLLSGLQFRITRIATKSNGEQELAVELELSGNNYSGVLISKTPNLISTGATTALTTVSTIGNKSIKHLHHTGGNITNCSQKTDQLNHISSNISTNSKKTCNDLDVALDAVVDISEQQRDEAEKPSNTTSSTTVTTNSVIVNSPNSSTTELEDAP